MCCIYCILIQYGINYEQGFDWFDQGMQFFDFGYYGFVNGEMVGCVDKQYVVVVVFGVIECGCGNCCWFLVVVGWEEVDVSLCCDGFQLFNGGGMIDVVVDYQYFFFLVFFELFVQFGGGGGFVCVLKVGYEDDGWWLGGKVEGVGGVVYEFGQFFVYYVDQCLVWGQ